MKKTVISTGTDYFLLQVIITVVIDVIFLVVVNLGTSMPGKRKTFSVWEHFVLLSSGKIAECKHCKTQMSYCGSTGSLIKHLKAKHVFLNLTAKASSGETSQETPEPPLKQQKLTSYARTPVTPSQAIVIDGLILNTIVGDLRPINLVEGEHFKKLMNYLVPGYDIPSRKTMMKNIEDKWADGQSKMRALLANVKFAAFTTDMWSNTKRESFLGLTIHFIDKNYKLVNLVLATKEVNEEHSGDNLVAWLEAILEEYEVSPHQIVGVVTDNEGIISKC